MKKNKCNNCNKYERALLKIASNTQCVMSLRVAMETLGIKNIEALLKRAKREGVAQ